MRGETTQSDGASTTISVTESVTRSIVQRRNSRSNTAFEPSRATRSHLTLPSGQNPMEAEMKKLTYVAPLALAAAAFLAAGTPETLARGRDVSTLHIEVVEDDGDSPKVKMAMPVALIEAMISSIDIDEFTSKHFMGELEHEGIDLRRFWQEVRDADIKEFFTLETEDANIRAWRENGLFRVSVDADEGRRRDRTRVEISIPESLMDLLVGNADTDPADAITALLDHGPMTLVEVETDDGESVKIWID